MIINKLYILWIYLVVHKITFSFALEIYRVFTSDGEFENRTISMENIRLKKQDFNIFHIPNGFYYYYDSSRLFFDENGDVVRPISGHSRKINHIQDLVPTNFANNVNGTLYGNLIVIQSMCQYWHFHYETIGQLHLYEVAGVFDRYRNQQTFIHFDSRCILQGMYREIFRFYGFVDLLQSFRSLKSFGKVAVTVKGGNIVMSTNTGRFLPYVSTAQFMNERAIIFRESVESTRSKREEKDPILKHRRIFIGRDDKKTRGILNMHEMRAMFQRLNIFYFNPAFDGSYFNQVYLFSHAELVIGVSGTGFSTNMAFCDVDSTVLVEIIPKTPATSTGRKVAEALNFAHYHRFTGGTYNTTDSTRQARFHVNVTMLEDYLRHKIDPLHTTTTTTTP